MVATRDLDELLGRLRQLQTRYPALIRDIRVAPLHIDIEFYLVDLAIDAAHCLLEQGITAVHRMQLPQVISLQLPSLFAQRQTALLFRVLDRFLRQRTRRPPEDPL
jgi:4-aminobutyrate aminotransferase-like enzyme